MLILLPNYIALLFALVKRKMISAPVKSFVISYLAIHMLIVGITTVDWDGRFLLPMLPVIFIVGATVLVNSAMIVVNRLKKTLQNF